jgi:hypothetical protein
MDDEEKGIVMFKRAEMSLLFLPIFAAVILRFVGILAQAIDSLSAS